MDLRVPCPAARSVGPETMGSYRLRPSLHYCRLGRRIICLDLDTDRYSLLEGDVANDLAAFLDDTASIEASRRLADLGLIEPGVPTSPLPMAAGPAASLLDHPPPKPSPWLLLGAIGEQYRMNKKLERQPLRVLLAETGLARGDAASCLAVAAAFARAPRYRNATDQCLLRSLAMRAMLARRGVGVDLVIGVTLPFAAHCWIQAGPVVLSDPLDHVRNFTPLLTAR